jgi:hypothetical protein
MLEAIYKLSVELLHWGVTTAIMEAAYLMWWLRVSRVAGGWAQPESPSPEGRRPVLESSVPAGHLARIRQTGQCLVSLAS